MPFRTTKPHLSPAGVKQGLNSSSKQLLGDLSLGEHHTASSTPARQTNTQPYRLPSRIQATYTPVAQGYDLQGNTNNKSTAASIRTPAGHRPVSITRSEIVDMWAPVQRQVGEALGPLRENLSSPQFIRQIRKAIKDPGDFAAHPEIICVPGTATTLSNKNCEEVLCVPPGTTHSVPHKLSGHSASFHKVIADSAVPEAEINVYHEASHQCHLNACLIPRHINPSLLTTNKDC